MAATTTARNACDVSVWLDDATGVQRDISGSANSVDFNFTQEIGEFVVFGDHWTHRLCCGKDGNFSLNVVYTTTVNEGWDVVKNWLFGTECERRTFTVYIPNKNVGSDMFQAEVIWDNITWTTDRGDAGPIMVTVSLPADGEVTHTTAAT